MQRESLRGAWQRALHVAGVAAGWALFFYWWYLVAVADWNETDVALIIFVTLVVSPVLTLGWVAHNVDLFRRKGPRMALPTVSLQYEKDWNGRVVEADWAALRNADVIAVFAEGPRKRYVAESASPRGEPVATTLATTSRLAETEPA
jgi:hypothetical protein